VAFIEIHYHQLQNSTQNFSVQQGMIHTWEGQTCYAMLWRSLKGSPTVWNLLPPMPIHWCPSALEIRLQTYCTDYFNPILWTNEQHCKLIISTAPYLDSFLSYILLKLMYPTTPVSTSWEPTVW
jgi:hypothetical protein